MPLDLHPLLGRIASDRNTKFGGYRFQAVAASRSSGGLGIGCNAS